MLSINSTFNFLASLINGNPYTLSYRVERWNPFNFLASLINGNRLVRPC